MFKLLLSFNHNHSGAQEKTCVFLIDSPLLLLLDSPRISEQSRVVSAMQSHDYVQRSR